MIFFINWGQIYDQWMGVLKNVLEEGNCVIMLTGKDVHIKIFRINVYYFMESK